MLVLTRKKEESIMIGDDIKVTIMEIRKDGTVRIGIEAPKNIDIHREEVYKAIQEENKLAAQAPKDLDILGQLFRG